MRLLFPPMLARCRMTDCDMPQAQLLVRESRQSSKAPGHDPACDGLEVTARPAAKIPIASYMSNIYLTKASSARCCMAKAQRSPYLSSIQATTSGDGSPPGCCDPLLLLSSSMLLTSISSASLSSSAGSGLSIFGDQSDLVVIKRQASKRIEE